MRIKSTNFESQGAFVEINDADFDPKTMTEYKEVEQAESKKPAPAKKEKAE